MLHYNDASTDLLFEIISGKQKNIASKLSQLANITEVSGGLPNMAVAILWVERKGWYWMQRIWCYFTKPKEFWEVYKQKVYVNSKAK